MRRTLHSLLFSLLIASTNALPTVENVRDSDNCISETEWDAIVVGAGPAGIIVADRMSEAGLRTLLLEQGGTSYYITGGRQRPQWLNNTNMSRVDVPGLYKSIYSNPDDMLCNTTTQINAYGGCTIGGATAINAGLFFQPPASDFDDYFPDGWKSADVAGAISKLRSKQPFTDNPSANGRYYVQSGYDAAKEWLVKGAGYSEVTFNDKSDDKTNVFGHPEFMYVNGQRSGPVVTYLQTALQRPNFRFEHNVQVKRVVRDGETAQGVTAMINNVETPLKLSKTGRVILSAGAFGSPGLLMTTGIGNPSILSTIPHLISSPPSQWINNTAVGAGLFDNPNTFIELEGPSITSYTYNYSSPIPSDASLYLDSRSGPYAFASETSAFWTYIPSSKNSTHKIGVQGTIDSAGFSAFTSNKTITLNVYGTSGLGSTGNVIVNTTTGIPGPKKGSFFYSSPEDAPAIATFIHDIFAALSKSGSGLKPLNIPQNASVQEIQKYITSPSAYTLGNVNHWSSSCRIGECVDAETRVKGMKNLYVVDASIVAPLTVNPSFGIMVAAERASEVILKGLGKA